MTNLNHSHAVRQPINPLAGSFDAGVPKKQSHGLLMLPDPNKSKLGEWSRAGCLEDASVGIRGASENSFVGVWPGKPGAFFGI